MKESSAKSSACCPRNGRQSKADGGKESEATASALTGKHGDASRDCSRVAPPAPHAGPRDGVTPVRSWTFIRPSSMAVAIMSQGKVLPEGFLNEPPLRQRLATILVADVAGYSRLMGCDECGTVAALDAARAVFRRLADAHQGRIIDMAGDSVLAAFESANGGVACALAVQAELAAANESLAEDCRMRFRIGVHLGDVME